MRDIYRSSALCIALIAAAMLLPRAFRGPGAGFAEATSAAAIFLALAAVAVVAALVLLVRTARRWPALSRPARIAGVIPLVLIIGGGMALWLRATHGG